jgi:hypothetical protein
LTTETHNTPANDLLTTHSVGTTLIEMLKKEAGESDKTPSIGPN